MTLIRSGITHCQSSNLVVFYFFKQVLVVILALLELQDCQVLMAPLEQKVIEALMAGLEAQEDEVMFHLHILYLNCSFLSYILLVDSLS